MYRLADNQGFWGGIAIRSGILDKVAKLTRKLKAHE
jgi:hypothetical protein